MQGGGSQSQQWAQGIEAKLRLSIAVGGQGIRERGGAAAGGGGGGGGGAGNPSEAWRRQLLTSLTHNIGTWQRRQARARFRSRPTRYTVGGHKNEANTEHTGVFSGERRGGGVFSCERKDGGSHSGEWFFGARAKATAVT